MARAIIFSLPHRLMDAQISNQEKPQEEALTTKNTNDTKKDNE
jgi:hypothetical protein